MTSFARGGSLAKGLAATLSFTALVGCGERGKVALSKSSEADLDEAALAKIPVPDEQGPKLTALTGEVVVRSQPRRDAAAVGGLLYGVPVARADKPLRTTSDCQAGWYPVRPRGFVCADAEVSLDAKPLATRPDLASALPYRFATVRATTPLYTRLPSAEEQMLNEPTLDAHLARCEREKRTFLRVGAIDVPLDESGVATGVGFLRRSGVGVGPDGHRTRTSYFDFGQDGVRSVAERAGVELVAKVARKGAGLALMGSVEHEGPRGVRQFAITADGLLAPVDRLDPALGSTWHGVALTEEKSLPLGFVLRHEAHPYELAKAKAERIEDDELDRRAAVHLTGRFRTVDGIRFEETHDGTWLRDRDLIKLVKRNKFPDFVTEGTRWIDVSLALQSMTLYEGRKPVYATLVSSGRDLLGDPASTASTPQGTFEITRSAVLGPRDERESGQAFELRQVPHVMEFAPDTALVGAFWTDTAGEARMHHDVALTPIDAHRVSRWIGADLPTGFSWAPNTSRVMVHVRK
jgi:hypothetical protein